MDRRNLLTGLSLAGVAVAAVENSSADAQDRGAARSLIERFASTLSAHDIDGFAALFADDYVNHQVSAAAPPPAAGVTPKQGTVRFFAGRLKACPTSRRRSRRASRTATRRPRASSTRARTRAIISAWRQPGAGCGSPHAISSASSTARSSSTGHGDIAGVMAQLKS